MSGGEAGFDEFAPPSGYAFEPELTGPPPRPLAEALERGPYARETRRSITSVFVFGLACFVLRYVPGIDTLAYYLLPLTYLNWIGLAIVLIAVARVAYYTLRRGPFRYVREGEALVARVAELSLEPSGLGHNVQLYKAALLYRHPETGAVSRAVVKSKTIAPLDLHKYAPRFAAGDYMTALYLPAKGVEKSLQLYAFLDVSPEVNLRGGAAAGSSLISTLKLLASIAFVFVLLANVYALGRYTPLDFPPRPLLLAAVAGGLLLGSVLFFLMRPRMFRPRQPIVSALFTGIAALLLGAMTGVCWSFMANAWLDRSPARTQAATVQGLWMKTYNYVFRSYELEYRLGESYEAHHLLTTREHLDRFHARAAVAHVRQGAFGWPWVETVEPEPDVKGAASVSLRPNPAVRASPGVRVSPAKHR